MKKIDKIIQAFKKQKFSDKRLKENFLWHLNEFKKIKKIPKYYMIHWTQFGFGGKDIPCVFFEGMAPPYISALEDNCLQQLFCFNRKEYQKLIKSWGLTQKTLLEKYYKEEKCIFVTNDNKLIPAGIKK